MENQQMENQKLSELDDWQLQDSDQDVRGRQLITTSGDELGTIDDMIVDTEQERVSAVCLEDGRTFPAESLEIRDEGVITHQEGTERPPTVTIYSARLIRPVRSI